MICTLAAALMTGAGCSGQEQPKVSVEPAKVLVAYYSWGGNTKYAAAQIQKATGGTLFEIKPVKPYPSGYRECTVQAKKEIQEGVRPELAARVEDMGKYDVIFIGQSQLVEHDCASGRLFPGKPRPFRQDGDSVCDARRRRHGALRGRGAEAVPQVHRSQGRSFCRGRHPDGQARAGQVGQ